jgi:aminoglycoside phosphotransferase (APT) family kinase protein
MSEAELLASGRDADVVALGQNRVVRRYRRGGDVGREARFMRQLAALGYPVPAVHRAEGPELEMERLTGATMLAALEAGDLDFAEGASLLVELHDRLHALPAPKGEAVLHMDLHPGNVMLTDRGPVVIDWRDVRIGPAELDLAMTCLVFGSVAVGGDGPLAGPGRAAWRFTRAFVPLAGDRVLLVLDRAVELRCSNGNVGASEREDVREAAELVRRLLRRARAGRSDLAGRPEPHPDSDK